MMLPSVAVHALGMGEIEVHSALNEPLNAQIKLLSATAAELSALQVALASNEVFGRMGIDRSPSLRDLRFEVVTQGAGAPYVRVASTTPIREPFLDIILMANWANGQLVREYTLLLDPPVFDEGQSAVPVQAAQTESSAISRGQKREAAPAAAAPASAPAAPSMDSQGGYGPTKRTDTLWSVAREMRPDGSVDVPRMMLAILKENPEAFVDGNVNNMKAGYILRSPSMDVVNSFSASQAAAEINRQYQEWQAATGRPAGSPSRQQVAAASAGAGSTVMPAPVVDSSARLKLLTPEESKQQAGSGSAGQGRDAVMGQLALALETAEATKQENAELKARLADLERQLQAVQRLLTLKGDTLGALQAGAGQTPEAVGAPLPEEPLSASGVAADEGADQMAGVTESAESVAAEPAQPAEPQAVPAAPVAALDDAAEPGVLDKVLADPVLLGAAAGGPLLLLLVAALIRRRRQKSESDSADRLFAAAMMPGADDDLMPKGASAGMGAVAKQDVEDDFGGMIDASASADFGTSSGIGAIHAEESEIDPIAEADVYLAYRRYEQAEALLKDAIRNDPGRNELKLKLLEIYFTTKDKDAFEAQAEGLYAALGGQEGEIWSQAVEMGREISPEHPLFAESDTGGAAAFRGAGMGAAAVGGAAVAGVAAADEFSFDLSDDELAKSLEMPSLDQSASDADVLDLDMIGEEGGELLSFDEKDLDAAAEDVEEFSLDGSLDGLDDAALSSGDGLDLSDADLNLLDQPIDGDELKLDDDLTSEFDLDALESLDVTGDASDGADQGGGMDEWTIAPAVSSFTSRDVKSEMDDGYVPPANMATGIAESGAGQFDLDDAALDLGDGLENNLFDGSDDILGTKLDLARAYIEMGDEGGARSILDEVVKEGGDNHRQEAEQLMRQIS